MLLINKDDQQILLSQEDKRQLHYEFEQLFIQFDKESNGQHYSLINVKKQIPAVAELYELICFGLRLG